MAIREDITVQGRRGADNFDLNSLNRAGGLGATSLGGATNAVNTATAETSGQRLAQLNAPVAPTSQRTVTPTVVSQPQSTLGNLVGARTPTGYGASARFNFAKGGAAKANAKPKKMAKGGKVSSASKRADGIARKGKTRGKMC